jgi:hypothetical protein
VVKLVMLQELLIRNGDRGVDVDEGDTEGGLGLSACHHVHCPSKVRL